MTDAHETKAEVVRLRDNDAPPPIFPIETEQIRNHVGAETTVRILVQGPFGPKEIGKLIRLLEAQRAVLEEGEAQS